MREQRSTHVSAQNLSEHLGLAYATVRNSLAGSFRLQASDLDDIVQDAAVRVFATFTRARLTFPSPTAFIAYLHVTAKRLALDVLRERGTRVVLSFDTAEEDAAIPEPCGSDDTIGAVADQEQSEELRRRLTDLSPRERQVLELFAEGLAIRDIAKHLGVTENAASLGKRQGILRLTAHTSPRQLEQGHFGGRASSTSVGYMRLGGSHVAGQGAPRPVPCVDAASTVRLRFRVDGVDPQPTMVAIPHLFHGGEPLSCLPTAVAITGDGQSPVFTATMTLTLADGRPAPAGAELVEFELLELAF